MTAARIAVTALLIFACLYPLTNFARRVLNTNPHTPQTGHLRACIEQFEDAADNLTPDVKIVACQVLRAGARLTGESTGDLVDSLPDVAVWIGGQP